jgi:hypothetical protein
VKLTKLPWSLLALSLVPSGAIAQAIEAGAKTDKVPRAIQALADRAAGAPPEFSADILLKLAGHPDVHDKAWRIRVIEDAFAIAANAQNPYKRVGSSNTDTLDARQSWDHGLDALSLQCRAVESMLGVDPKQARDLFDRITLRQLPRPECREALSPDISGYYKTLTLILGGAYSAAERAKGRDIEALESQIQLAGAPSQIAPLARVILTAPVNTTERQRLLSALAVALPRLSTSDRQFRACEYDLSNVSYEIQRQAPAALAVWAPAMREFLVRQYRIPRCGDHHDSKDGLPETASEFNAFLEKLKSEQASVSNTVKPITKDEARPSEVADSMQVVMFWQSDAARKILSALKWLTHGNRDLPDSQRFWTDAERATTEWEARRLELLKLLDDWNEGSEDAAALYHMKASAYSLLAKLTPEGKARDNALTIFLSFLDQNYSQIENHSEWFTEFALFRDQMHYRKEDSRMLNPMKQASSPVIPLYAGWLEIAPPESPR